jgi:tetratricopeptide (TPR) repeat protein
VAARLALARWLVGIGRVEWASREYQAALELDPHRDEVYLELGKTLEREFLWEEALACFRLARKNGVDSAALLYGEGKLLMRFGMPGQAIGLLRRALELDRGDTRVRLALGECLLEIGQTLAAIDELKQSYGASAPTGTSVLNPLWVDAAVALGRSLLHVGDFREAMRYYRSVVEEDRDRTCTVARKGLGASLYATGTSYGLNEALDVWSSVNENGLSREVLINRGYGLARLGRYAEARTAFESARRDDPLHAGLATTGLAFVAECEGKYDSALELYGEALVSNPGALYVYLAMGRIQRKQGDFEAARASLQKVLDEAPDSVDALVEMATAALAVNQYADALRYLERVREIEPATLHWQSMLGAALLRAQREQQAVDTFEKVLARRDDDPVSLVNQAVVYYRRGEVAKAIGNLQSAVESGRTDPTVQPLVDYARRTAAAIEDNTRKRLWEDDFNRTEIRNDWTTEHSHGVIIREHNGQVHFAGMQKDGNDTETALLRTVSLGELVTFDAALTVSPGVKARTGVEMMVRRGGRSTTTLMGAIQFGRDSRGQMAYRVFDDGAFQDWQLLGGTWPGPGAVRLGFERADPTGYKWNLTVNGRVIKRGVEVKKFRNWNRDGLIGVFGSAKLGTEWSFDMDDVRMILRLPK